MRPRLCASSEIAIVERLAAAVPGRNPAIDGFGLIAFASLFPIITVLGYGQYAQWMNHRARRQIKEKHHEI